MGLDSGDHHSSGALFDDSVGSESGNALGSWSIPGPQGPRRWRPLLTPLAQYAPDLADTPLAFWGDNHPLAGLPGLASVTDRTAEARQAQRWAHPQYHGGNC